jgi:ppGpp synthetase/RelA/SpoT-type nucleotidyltranferase
LLTRTDIEHIVARYSTEHVRFESVANEVHRVVQNLLVARGVKALVSSRAKTPSSLKGKLLRRSDDFDPKLFRSALAPPLTDLAGVRVLLYRVEDMDPTTKALREAFSFSSVKWPLRDKKSDRYYAVHLFGALFDVVKWEQAGRGQGHMVDDAHDPFVDVREIPCEIQICPITRHVWNELEHDIIYKQPDGQPDEGQRELLESLLDDVKQVDRTALRLMRRTAARRDANDEEIGQPQELRRYLERRVGCTVEGPFADLLSLLQLLMRRISPQVMDGLFATGMTEDVARSICREFDPDGAHDELGHIAVRLLPSLGSEEVRTVAPDVDVPIVRFLVRVADSGKAG